ncbi:MAG: DNA polymerase III subunit delta' [Burkholderiaceae bacterium]|jgi:DNA polymerase-3 subunit delta'|nr:DNA polymerase III subunit delta' [Burkholderiaceae bacterium]
MTSNPQPLAPWLARQLIDLLARRGHAWLLQGPSGLGQFELGLALARAWLCEAPTLPAARGSLPPEGALAALRRPGGGSEAHTPKGACGACTSCHAIDVHTHADFAALMPESDLLARGWPLDEEAQSELDDKKRKPGKEIRVNAMRAVIEFTQRTSARGRGKAVLIYPAERMNAVTANALLKTLEEPPGDVRFVLASDAAHALLPTLRSRCQTHTMIWPDTNEALAWLAGQGVPADAALALLNAAGGRPEAALALAQSASGAHDAAQAWAGLPKTLVRGGAAAVAAVADLPAPELIARLQKLCHDLMAAQTGAAPRFFTAADLPRLPVNARQMQLLARWAKQLAREARVAEHPFNAGLTAEALVGSARIALNSQY